MLCNWFNVRLRRLVLLVGLLTVARMADRPAARSAASIRKEEEGPGRKDRGKTSRSSPLARTEAALSLPQPALRESLSCRRTALETAQ